MKIKGYQYYCFPFKLSINSVINRAAIFHLIVVDDKPL